MPRPGGQGQPAPALTARHELRPDRAAGSTAPLGRFGTAEEDAAAGLFLMANTYVTGQIITIDGGETPT
ncbi:SDR family oxidoreductase [Actinopolymorpha pittospori]|uniref:SDR family oxidoreductase n=1 Tax=Actinopolymorpha pittospori TaxID=648752 RepID=UPI00178A9048|nr:SDR family oxidoreductase [Actinopolymorpha pittospori]